MRKFFIQSKQSEGTAPLYTRVRRNNPPLNMWVNTHIEVDIAKWKKCYEDLQLYAKTGKEGKKTELLAHGVDNAIEDVIKTKEFGKDDIQEAVNAVVFKEAREERRKMEEEAEHQRLAEAERENEAKAKEDADVLLYLSRLIEKMENREVMTEGKGNNTGDYYTNSTIKMWQSLHKIIERYNSKITWQEIDKDFANAFRRRMEKEGYMAKSINKYIGQFVALINRAHSDGKHNNTEAINAFKNTKKRIDETDKATEIYLTAEELKALYEMPLKGGKAVARDIFVLGCCTCQRVSDYSNLSRENFTTTARGTKVIKLRQTKTRNFVVIPILDDKIVKIAERYDYQIPKISDVNINRYIKNICKELSKSVKSLAEELPTLLTMKERAMEKKAKKELFKRNEKGQVVKPRYAMVTSHTARRTGITNLYLSGKFDVYQMMAISGHKEAKTFKEYIKLSGDDIADQIADKMADENLF